jgi:hypothetical protein
MLVVDNDSSDESLSEARRAGFETLEMSRNAGFGAACNAGLQAVDNEFVLICNPDVVPEHEAIERLVSALQRNPDAAIEGATFGGNFEGRRFARIPRHLASFLPRRLTEKEPLKRIDMRVEVDRSRCEVEVDYAVGAFILCRRQVVEDVGGFDERFFLYFEEADLALRLGEAGWKTFLVSKARVAHGQSASSDGLSRSALTPFRLHSAYWFYRKHHTRLYAECARVVLSLGVGTDRVYRRLSARPQVYGKGTALAAFKSLETLKSEQLVSPSPSVGDQAA